MRLLLAILLCSCSLSSPSWPVFGDSNPADHAYPQWRWCPLKEQAVEGRTAWPIDEHTYVSAYDGALVVVSGMYHLPPISPCAVGFVDRPYVDFSVHAGDHVWIAWEGGYVARQHLKDDHHLALPLPAEAIGAPVLRQCGDCYPPSGAGGYDSVVGVVLDATTIATLDDINALVAAERLAPYYNLDFADGHSSFGTNGERE
jgi:hypothetical protein